jgi:hypothetical protein
VADEWGTPVEDGSEWGKPVGTATPPPTTPAPAAKPAAPPAESTTTRFARGAGLPTNWREAATGAAEMAVPGLGPLANTVGTLRSLPDTARYWSDMAAHPSKLGPTLSTIKPELAGLGTSTAAMMMAPGGKPVARGAGAVMENAGRLGSTPIGNLRYRGVGVTPANIIGALGGAKTGAMLHGVPEAPYIGTVAGAAAGDALARGVESGGAALRRWGGYEPPAPPASVRYPDFKPPTPVAASRYLGVEPPISEGAAPARFTQQPRLTQGGKPFRAGGQPAPKPTPFKTTDVSRPFPASRFTQYEPATPVPPAPQLQRIPQPVEAVPTPVPAAPPLRRIPQPVEATPTPVPHAPPQPRIPQRPEAPPEPSPITQPGQAATGRIIQPAGNPPKGFADIRARYGGDPWTWPKDVRQFALDQGDPDMVRLAPAMGLKRSGLPEPHQYKDFKRGY